MKPLYLAFLIVFIAGSLTGCQDSPRTSGNLVATSIQEDPNAQIVFRKDGIADISFDSLKIEIEPGEDYSDDMMTDKIRALDGKQVIIRGFILPGSVWQDTIKEFVLIRDNQQCCFGPGAKLYHNMQVEMEEGTTTKFSTFPVTLQGEFHIRPWHAPDGKCYSIYHITAHSVTR